MGCSKEDSLFYDQMIELLQLWLFRSDYANPKPSDWSA